MVPTRQPGPAVRATPFLLVSFSMLIAASETANAQPGALRFEVRISQSPAAPASRPEQPDTQPRSGRLFVILGKPATGDPRLSIGETGTNAPPILGRDVVNLAPGAAAVLDDRSAIFPIAGLSRLRPGTYAIQALFHRNRDLNLVNAPGDQYSPVTTVRLDPAAGGTINLELSRQVSAETLPPDQDLVKYVKISSPLLSAFHNRPIDLRAGVILPRNFHRHPELHYPVRVHIGGYGCRFTSVGTMMRLDSEFHRTGRPTVRRR